MNLTKKIVCLLAFGGVSMLNAGAQRKNVLLIMADDFNHWVKKIGYYDQALTPNIDALADMGVLFTDASCSAPVCNPSRNALMSGFRPSTSGIVGNSDGFIREKEGFEQVKTMNQFFTENGYYTYAGGKIYHKGKMGSPVTDPDNWSDLYKGGSGASGLGSPEGKPWTWRGTAAGTVQLSWKAGTTGPVEEDGDTRLAYHFAEKIRNHNSSSQSNKPFFFACGFFRPHLPFHCNKQFFDLYDPDTLRLPQGVVISRDSVVKGNDMHTEVLEEGVWKYAIRAYLANMSYTDYNVGIVLDALEESGQSDNTIVVFVGDHGWQLGEKRKWKKAAVHDPANRTTLIIYDPSASGNGQICRKVVSLQDIYPTLVGLCDLGDREDIEGNNLDPLLENPNQTSWEKPILINIKEGKTSGDILKTNEWRYIRTKNEELYNIKEDPYEAKNLINDPAYTDLIARLSKQIDSIKAEGVRRKFLIAK